MQLREELDPKGSKKQPHGMGLGQSMNLADERTQSKEQHVPKDSQTGDLEQKTNVAAIQHTPLRPGTNPSAHAEKRWRREVAAAAADPMYVKAHPAVAAAFGGRPDPNLVEEAAARMRDELTPKRGKMGMGMGA